MALPYYDILRALLAQPTAPFREAHAAREVVAQLDAAKVPWFGDHAGNLIVGVAGARAYRELLRTPSDQPLRLFMAHLDHPGFHATRWLDGRTLAVRWLGGSPVKHLRGATVWLADESGELGHGRLQNPRLARSGRALESAAVRVDDVSLRRRIKGARGIFGGFGFRAPFWRAGRRIYARAADDLAGVSVVVALARQWFASGAKSPLPFLCLLTRGEEVGFVGAVAHLDRGWLAAARRPLLAVSVETSRALPGAAIGKGPVVRLGDRRTVFAPEPLALVSELAQRLLPQNHQRRIMDGGACEGTATTACGLPTIGLSIPLGNYHNQGIEGGPDCRGSGGPAPEFVNLGDIEGMLKLCWALVSEQLPWADPWAETRKRLMGNFRRYSRHLPGTVRS